MRKILVVPDVHGRKFWEAALDYPGEVIFLGDYTDPYPKEGITMEEAYTEFQRIIEFKRRNPDRVSLLIGNHEMHYYDPCYRCWRYSPVYYEAMHEQLCGEDNAGLFHICRLIGKHLFIHAGILKGWLKSHESELNKIAGNLDDKLNSYFIINRDAYAEVSFFRGGNNSYGSPLWADIHEHIEAIAPFDPDIIQIIGHTQIKSEEPYVTGQIHLLDNRKVHEIEVER